MQKQARNPKSKALDQGSAPPVRIYTLGRFDVLLNGKPLRFAGKLPRKPLSLLKAIIAAGGENVAEDTLLDTLWPNGHGDAAQFSLTSTIYRLRRLFSRKEAVLRNDGKLSLNPKLCWLDIWEIERLLDEIELKTSVERGEFFDRTINNLVREAAMLYRGRFLDNEAAAPRPSLRVEHLIRRLQKQLSVVGDYAQGQQQWETASFWYEKAMSVDPCAEDICRKLMTVYDKLERPAEISRTYHQCRQALAHRLGIEPSVKTEAILRQLRTGSVRDGVDVKENV